MKDIQISSVRLHTDPHPEHKNITLEFRSTCGYSVYKTFDQARYPTAPQLATDLREFANVIDGWE